MSTTLQMAEPAKVPPTGHPFALNLDGWVPEGEPAQVKIRIDRSGLNRIRGMTLQGMLDGLREQMSGMLGPGRMLYTPLDGGVEQTPEWIEYSGWLTFFPEEN